MSIKAAHDWATRQPRLAVRGVILDAVLEQLDSPQGHSGLIDFFWNEPPLLIDLFRQVNQQRLEAKREAIDNLIGAMSMLGVTALQDFVTQTPRLESRPAAQRHKCLKLNAEMALAQQHLFAELKGFEHDDCMRSALSFSFAADWMLKQSDQHKGFEALELREALCVWGGEAQRCQGLFESNTLLNNRWQHLRSARQLAADVAAHGWSHSKTLNQLKLEADASRFEVDELQANWHTQAAEAARNPLMQQVPHFIYYLLDPYYDEPSARTAQTAEKPKEVAKAEIAAEAKAVNQHSPKPLLVAEAATQRKNAEPIAQKPQIQKNVAQASTAPVVPAVEPETRQPPSYDLKQLQAQMQKLAREDAHLAQVLHALVDGLKQMSPGSRVLLLLLSQDKNQLQGRIHAGFSTEQMPLTQIKLELKSSRLLVNLLQKPVSVHIQKRNWAQYEKALPAPIRLQFKQKQMLLMSLFIDQKPLGVLYQDCPEGELGEQDFTRFKQAVLLTAKVLSLLKHKAQQKKAKA